MARSSCSASRMSEMNSRCRRIRWEARESASGVMLSLPVSRTRSSQVSVSAATSGSIGLPSMTIRSVGPMAAAAVAVMSSKSSATSSRCRSGSTPETPSVRISSGSVPP